jgi:RNA polymerase sigma-70 factor, ECF subfamily
MADAPDDLIVFELFRAGDDAGAKELFDRYVEQVMKLARRRLSRTMARRVDAEDIAQSVFRTFFVRARKGQFQFEEAEDLCKILARITVHKTLRQIAYHKRAKRDTGAESGADTQELLLNRLAGGATPEDAAIFVDELEHLFQKLQPTERAILELRMEGYNNLEIADKLGISDRKIRRLMERVKGLAEHLGMKDATEK